jgi:hypothetical protein
MPALSQTIPWDPTAFTGFSDEQVELIRRGFNFALDRVYARETDAYAERQMPEFADPEDMASDLEAARAASRIELDAASDAGCEDSEFCPERWREGKARAAYIDGWNRCNPEDQR